MSSATRRTRLARLAVAGGIGVAIASGQAVAHADGESPDAGTPSDPTTAHTHDAGPPASSVDEKRPHAAIFSGPIHRLLTGATSPRVPAKNPDPAGSNAVESPRTLDAATPAADGPGALTRHERRALSIARRATAPSVRDTAIANDPSVGTVAASKVVAPQSVTAPTPLARSLPITPTIQTALAPSPPATAVGPTVSLQPFAGVARVLNAIGAALNGGPGIPPSPTPLWAVLTAVHQEVRRFLFNGAPSVGGQQTSTYVEDDGTVRGTFTASDPDGDDVAVLASTPAHGEVALDYDTQTWSYTPETGYTGPDSFTLTARDGGLHLDTFFGGHRAQTTVAVTVANNVPPTPNPTNPFTIVDALPGDPPGTVRGRVNVGDADPLTYTATPTSAKGGTVTVDANGNFVYTPSTSARIGAADPNAATTGADKDTFTITASDGRATVGVPVTITVAPAPITLSAIDLNAGSEASSQTIAISADGTRVIVGTYRNQIVLIDASKNPPTTVAVAGGNNTKVAMSADGTRAYAIGFLGISNDAEMLTIIDPTADDPLLASIPITGSLLAVGPSAGSADGTHFYVSEVNGKYVRIVDTSQSVVSPRIVEVPVGATPRAIVVNDAGTRGYVLTDNNIVIIDDSQSPASPTVTNLPVQAGSIATSADGTRLYATTSGNTVTIIDTSSSVTSPTSYTVAAGERPNSVAVSADGTHAIVTNVGPGTIGSAANAAPDSVSVIDFTGATPVVIQLDGDDGIGNQPKTVAMSADGTRAYVVYWNSPKITVIDLSGAAPVVTNLTAPERVTSVVVNEDGTHAYFVTNETDIISLDTGGV